MGVDECPLCIGVIDCKVVTVDRRASAYAKIVGLSKLGTEHILFHIGKKVILTQSLDTGIVLSVANHSCLIFCYKGAHLAHSAAIGYGSASGVLVVKLYLSVDIVACTSHMQIIKIRLREHLK